MTELLAERTFEIEDLDAQFEEVAHDLGGAALSLEDVQDFTDSILPPQAAFAPAFNSFVEAPEHAFSSSLLRQRSN